jgi:hypothetical protein
MIFPWKMPGNVFSSDHSLKLEGPGRVNDADLGLGEEGAGGAGDAALSCLVPYEPQRRRDSLEIKVQDTGNFNRVAR